MSALNFNTPFQPYRPTGSNFQNLTGQKKGRLTVFSLYGKTRISPIWLCRCECGSWCVKATQSLVKYQIPACRDCVNRFHTHKMSYSSEYDCFHSAKARCNNPAVGNYARYGGRGIEFRFTSFEEFLTEIGHKPTPRHSLNRIDNDGHYEKGNVEWATPKLQSQNREVSRTLTLNGVTKCIKAWSRSSPVSDATIYRRIGYGWCASCAITLSRNKKCLHVS
jgi:hypothetical protein